MRNYGSTGQKAPDRPIASTVDPLPTDADGDWPVTRDVPQYGALDFYPIPESWITHARTYDRGEGHERIYAVSAAVHGGWLILRYAHPRNAFVQYQRTTRYDAGDGWIPRALTNHSRQQWPRSIIPTRDPQDHRQPPETAHMVELWADHTDEIETDAELCRTMADGGLPIFDGGHK